MSRSGPPSRLHGHRIRWRGRRHGPHLARPAPQPPLPPGRVVLPPDLRCDGRPARRYGAQHAGPDHRCPLRDLRRPLEAAGPDREVPGRHGLGRLDRLLLVRGLRLLGEHERRRRPPQAARRPALAGQRRLHRPGAAGHGLRRGDDGDAARGHRRHGLGAATRAGRRGAGGTDHDDRRGERPLAVQHRARPDQPGLHGPLPDPGTDVVTAALAAFDRHRRLLFSVAYQMLGSVADAEDVVQDTWLRWSAADRSDVLDERAYLVRITSRLALDRMDSARARRESYVGPWLPEPLLTGGSPVAAAPQEPGPEDAAELGEQVSLALLVVLETLSPAERAVFVLREVFGMSVSEVAVALNRSEAAVRQMAHRAREHVHARQPRFDTDRREQQEVTERFLAAAVNGDVESLLAALAPGVVLVADGGGKVTAARRPIVGADKVARFLAAVGPQGAHLPGLRVEVSELNGAPAVVAWTDE